ncbi:hypothetical protein EB118_25710, partial [bacterium]|nr:hypothetical protein [bacterium]
MPTLLEILRDPNYINANPATKQAIFDKYAPQDTNYTEANDATKAAIRQRFGLGAAAPEPAAGVASLITPPTQPAPTAVPYRSKIEALDDAVNLIEEGAPANLVKQKFEQAGISWPDIIKHGQTRGSDYFKTKTIPVSERIVSAPSGEIKPSPEKGAAKAVTDTFKRAGASLNDVATSYLFQ